MRDAVKLYEEVSFNCSELITKKYSTSFSLGINTLEKKIHKPIYAIYGFVRFADEIVDTFHDLDKETILNQFEEDTYDAIEKKFSPNPVLHSFQSVVNKFDINKNHIQAFLNSMRMDLNMKVYTEKSYKDYIHGSAEVVGLMCLKVFCEDKEYNKLESYAISLGSAFQKVNFLRDMRSDYDERGRVYFPGIKFSGFTEKEKKDIEKDIEKDFQNALIGIKMLPTVARNGVYLSYKYYLELLNKIKIKDASQIKEERVRVSNFKKFIIFLKTYLTSI
ncbi:MAG: phytoene/squalene synthase family protein [Cytophagales bacterium]|nr:MAG: phytoene synthase [Rhodothermaeota bacterium MED-G18]|tara:strand:+ start:1734 stop:2561 length:828 start_codon:yes stop_codon:yes gene_type:complete